VRHFNIYIKQKIIDNSKLPLTNIIIEELARSTEVLSHAYTTMDAYLPYLAAESSMMI
jgi:hypothetical protein